jgi:hypothetical protein
VVVRHLFGTMEAEVLMAGSAVNQGRGMFRRSAERILERPGLCVRQLLGVQRHLIDTSPNVEMLRRFAERFREQDASWGDGRQYCRMTRDHSTPRPGSARVCTLSASWWIAGSR